MIKFYVASLLAFSDMQFVEGSQMEHGSFSQSIPAFVPARSMDEAVEQVRTYIFERWKPGDGWHTHQANIMALGEVQINAIRDAITSGLIDTSEEEPRTCNFDLA